MAACLATVPVQGLCSSVSTFLEHRLPLPLHCTSSLLKMCAEFDIQRVGIALAQLTLIHSDRSNFGHLHKIFDAPLFP